MEFNTLGTKILLGYVPLLTFFVDSWDHDDNVDIKVDDATDSVRNHDAAVKRKNNTKSTWERWHTKSLSTLKK